MTDEERRLAELLQKVVPQPPRPISADDIAARVAGRRRVALPGFQPWLPALAAACVLLVIAGTSVWLISGRSAPSAPAARPSSTAAGLSSTSSSSSASSSPSRSATSASSSAHQTTARSSASPRHTATGSMRPDPDATSVVPTGGIGAFGAQLLNVAPIGSVIVGGANTVYGLEGSQIDRFDLASGATTVQAPLDPNGYWPPLVTSRALWLTVVGPGTVTIEMLDPTTLRQIGSSQIAAASPSGTGPRWTPVLAANADDSEIFLGNADQIYSLDPASGTVEHQSGVPGLIGGLAVSPDGSRLYAGVNVSDSGIPRLLVLDVQHGLSTLSNTPFGSGAITGLLVTSGGVWGSLAGASPDDNTVRFAPLTDLSRTREVQHGGGGVPASANLAGGAVWLSGVYDITCNDPRTGAVRAQASQLGELGLAHYFRSVQLVGGRYYASFSTNGGDAGGAYVGLAVLNPPAACGG